ncbi:polyprenyl synthetase family protein [Streptomyces sp. TS71-3]|uniref:polyprenyl synthetase family protein n=1 Tax=Streptomyces sp. TS71-3 TaxID=2733862 RepID=UPI001B14B3EF|nr:polyprenyl synthetase family protein [Streptomyces sp. TS71-3]GHJ40342.1 polyprenyl synthetase [Streptomyces sp. TS71-3]
MTDRAAPGLDRPDPSRDHRETTEPTPAPAPWHPAPDRPDPADPGHWSTAVFRARIDAVLRDFLGGEADRLAAVDDDLAPVAERLRGAAGHGKRLRSAFCYWGWRAAGQPDNDALVRAAAAMELVHAAAIVHDDLIDDSPLRHGQPTVHLAFEKDLHGRPRARAAARSLAMLVGDHLMALAGHLFATSGLPAAYLARARGLWGDLARDLIAGECLEILRTGGRPDTEASLQVIRYKTAKYTVEQPLLMGALLGGAGPTLRECLSAYGLPLGEAFQLRDDLLGLFGDPERTGKAGLDDLSAQRPTALLAETWKAADAAQREELGRLLGRSDLEEAHLHRVRYLMLRLKAPERIEHMIRTRVEEATRALDDADVPAPARRTLADLALRATARSN